MDLGSNDPGFTALVASKVFHKNVIEHTHTKQKVLPSTSSTSPINLCDQRSSPLATTHNGIAQDNPIIASTMASVTATDTDLNHKSHRPIISIPTASRDTLKLPEKKKDNTGEHIDSALYSQVTAEPPPTKAELFKRIPPNQMKCYKAEGTFENALFVLVKHDWLDEDSKVVLSGMAADYSAIIEYVPLLLLVDFSSLLKEDLDYESVTEISKSKTWLQRR